MSKTTKRQSRSFSLANRNHGLEKGVEKQNYFVESVAVKLEPLATETGDAKLRTRYVLPYSVTELTVAGTAWRGCLLVI